jgi:hypothetical protein
VNRSRVTALLILGAAGTAVTTPGTPPASTTNPLATTRQSRRPSSIVSCLKSLLPETASAPQRPLPTGSRVLRSVPGF